jgi:hypothetical protein
MEEQGKKGKGGRPSKEVKMRQFPLHVYLPSEDAMTLIKEAAEQEGMAISTWARGVLLREARLITDGTS